MDLGVVGPPKKYDKLQKMKKKLALINMDLEGLSILVSETSYSKLATFDLRPLNVYGLQIYLSLNLRIFVVCSYAPHSSPPS